MTTETTTATTGATAEEKISQLRELFADAPEVGRKALENVLGQLTSQASQKPPPVESSTGTVYATVSVPNTGGWQTWTTVNATVQLPVGAQTLKVVSLNASVWTTP